MSGGVRICRINCDAGFISTMWELVDMWHWRSGSKTEFQVRLSKVELLVMIKMQDGLELSKMSTNKNKT